MKNLYYLSALAVVLLFAPCSRASPASIEGKVVRFADGDTITILTSSRGQQNIRLAGIDGPSGASRSLIARSRIYLISSLGSPLSLSTARLIAMAA
jgi:endonuclease YncB( thermonuclease family)